MNEKDRYEMVCKQQFDSLHKKIDGLSNRLFIDNGSESLQSKMNRHDIWIGRATRIGLAVAIAVFGLCIDGVRDSIMHPTPPYDPLQTLDARIAPISCPPTTYTANPSEI